MHENFLLKIVTSHQWFEGLSVATVAVYRGTRLTSVAMGPLTLEKDHKQRAPKVEVQVKHRRTASLEQPRVSAVPEATPAAASTCSGLPSVSEAGFPS